MAKKMPNFGAVPNPINSLDSFVNPCGSEKICMKIPNYLILMIDFKFNAKRH